MTGGQGPTRGRDRGSADAPAPGHGKGSGRRERGPSEKQALSVAIGRSLAEKRHEAGLTQVAVAQRLGRVNSWIAKLERGQRSLLYSEAVILAQLYGVELAAFWPESSERTNDA